MDLKDKVAIVTGAGRGIGKAITLALAREGCSLAISSDIQKEIKEVGKLAEDTGIEKVFCYCADLAEEKNILSLVKKTVERFGTIDILVNNAGICIEKPLLELTTNDWDKTFNINVRAPFILSREVMSIMKEKKDGHIINISSAIVSGGGPAADFVPYCASKHALMGLSKALYDESSKYGYNVMVSTIYPNMVKTLMTEDFKFSAEFPSYKWIDPNEIAKTVIYILKESETSHIENLYIMSRRF